MISKSTNGGDSWSTSNLGSVYSVSDLAIDTLNNQRIYAGTQGGMYKSVDGGSTWTSANSGLPISVYIRSLAIDPIRSNVVYAGIYGEPAYKSVNGGDSWSPLNTPFELYSLFTLAIDPTDAQTIYAGSDYGAYKSVDGGDTWNLVGPGLNELVTALAIDPKHGTLYAGTIGRGVFKTISLRPGDCDNSGSVTISEVQSAINMFLGLKGVASCVDIDGSMAVSIAEVQSALNTFLEL